MPSEPNDLLRAAREAAGMTQGTLAELANAQVEQATGKPGAMDADYIGKLERGVHRWPNQHYRVALRGVLHRQADVDLGFFSTRFRVATVERNPRYLDGGDDMERKTFLRVLAGSVAGVAFVDPLGHFAAGATTGGQRHVGQAEVDQVRSLARMFAGQDHQFGGGLSSQAAVTQLSTSANLLDGTFGKEVVRQQLFSAVADLADTAGGMCFDAGQHQHAERCFRFAVGCATESDDWPMRAKALSGLANLSVHLGRQDDALSFSEMALVRADRLTPVARAVMHSRHARALGLTGTHRGADCMTAVRQAEDYFVATGTDEPDWLIYYDEAHLERDLGRALLHLAVNGGDYQEAQSRLAAAIDKFPASHSRGKALAMANLAHLTMARDDPTEAVRLGNEALAAIGSVKSDRVMEALRHLRIAGQKRRSISGVRELNHRIDQALQVAV